MDDIAPTNEPPKPNIPRLTDDAKSQRAIVEAARWSLRDHSEIKLQPAGCRSKIRQTPGQRKDHGFDSANARCEEVRINQQLHADFFREKPASRRIPAAA